MELKDVKANQGNIEVVVTIVQKDSPRAFEKFGKSGKVCNATVKDQSGEVKMTLWNDDVDKVKVGDKVKIVNGWCSEYKGEKQLSTGKFGSLEVVEKASRLSDTQLVSGSQTEKIEPKPPVKEAKLDEELEDEETEIQEEDFEEEV